MNNIVLCSNAGSGYKTTQCILGMSNMFDKYSISVFRYHFNASAEGERLPTDGCNKAVKARRKMAMKGVYVPACTTTELEIHTQSYDRGTVGSHPVEISFDCKFEKLVETVEVMQKLRDFEFLTDGYIRVWRIFGIG